MPNSSESLSHAVPEPSTPQPTLAPGELATQLQLIPPIAPLSLVDPQRPFFAACRDTKCGSLAANAVFFAYASVAQSNGKTWKFHGKQVHYYARQARVMEILECDRKTVFRETRRLVNAGRLVRVKAGRGRIPHAFVVVPEGWGAQARGGTQPHQDSLDGAVCPLNRASTKRHGKNGARLVHEKSPSRDIHPPAGPVTHQPLAKKAASDVPSQAEQAQPPVGRPSLSLVEPRSDPARLKRWWASSSESTGRKRPSDRPLSLSQS